jgi:hypothetical protein
LTLKTAYDTAIKYGVYIGLAMGGVWFCMLGDYGLGNFHFISNNLWLF